MKRSLLLLLFLLIRQTIFAQFAGQVSDVDNRPIAYANVCLLSGDSILISGTVTDENGWFRIEQTADPCFLRISCIGYRNLYERLDPDKHRYVLNALDMRLDEVTVSAHRKNVKIQELDATIASLNEDVENLSTTTAAQSEKLKEQDKALHTAYYCFGTSKELKDQKILSGGGLFSKSKVLQAGFNKDYFISVDIREVKEIPLFAGKAKLKSNHPEGSYEFVEDEEGNLTLVITDAQAFWSLGKYLVIEVS